MRISYLNLHPKLHNAINTTKLLSIIYINHYKQTLSFIIIFKQIPLNNILRKTISGINRAILRMEKMLSFKNHSGMQKFSCNMRKVRLCKTTFIRSKAFQITITELFISEAIFQSSASSNYKILENMSFRN